MAMLGIGLGVASIVSVHIIGVQIGAQLDNLVPSYIARFNHFLHRDVHQDKLFSEQYFTIYRRWQAGQNPALSSIVDMAPLIDERSIVSGRAMRVIGIDVLSQSISFMNQLQQAPQGEPEQVPIQGVDFQDSRASIEEMFGGVWLDSESVEYFRTLNSAQPKQLTITNLSLKPYKVLGTLDLAEATLVADIATAQEILGWQQDRLSYIGLQVDSPRAAWIEIGEQFLPGLSAGLPKQEVLVSSAAITNDDGDWRILAADDQHPANLFGQSIVFNISALAALAMLVAWFLIYQIALFWLRRIWTTLQRFHLLGVSWLRLSMSFIAILTMLGLVAASIGVWIGHWLAERLVAIALQQSSVDMPLSIWALLKGYGSALLVCILGGGWALKQNLDNLNTRPGNVYRLYVGAIILVSLLGITAWGVFSQSSGLLGAFSAIAALSFVMVFLIAPILNFTRGYTGTRMAAGDRSRSSTWANSFRSIIRGKSDRGKNDTAKIGADQLAQNMRGPSHRNLLARASLREAIWYPKDTTIAFAALSLAVATAIGVGLMIDSFRKDFDEFLQARLTYDLVVEAADSRGNLDRENSLTDKADVGSKYADAERQITHWADALQRYILQSDLQGRVDQLQIYRHGRIRVRGIDVDLTVTKLTEFELTRYNIASPIGPNDVLIGEQFARTQQLKVDDLLSISSGQFRIAGIMQGFGDIKPSMVIGLSSPLAAEAKTVKSVSLLLSNHSEPAPIAGNLSEPSSVIADSASPEDKQTQMTKAIQQTGPGLEAIVQQLRSQFPNLSIQQQSKIRQQALAIFDQTFAITRVLIFLALLVAALGMYIAATALRINRASSTALLTSLGVSDRELFMVDFARSFGLACVTIFFALPLGIALGWILCAVVNPRAFGWEVQMHISFEAIAVPVFWGVFAAMVAGMLRVGAREEGRFANKQF